MKKNKLIVLLGALLLSSVAYGQTTQTLKWAYEDGNGDGVWNWSVTNPHFESGNQWGDIPLSTEEKYEGLSSMKFHYTYPEVQNPTGFDWAFAKVTTSYDNDGREPGSEEEKYAVKDLSSYRNLVFHVKGDAHSVVTISLSRPNGHGTNQLPLSDYAAIRDDEWTTVIIPLHEFNYQHGDFSIYEVYSVDFSVPQHASTEDFTFYVDNIHFTKYPPNRDNVNWFNYDANNDGALNYSSTENFDGSYIVGANQWGDVPVAEIFVGPVASRYNMVDVVRFSFNHNGSGSAYAHVTAGVNNEGLEARSFEEKNRGKNIGYDRTLVFTLFGGRANSYIKLVDKWGNSSTELFIDDYRGDYGRYGFGVQIPVWDFFEEKLDITNIVSVTVFVDEKVPAGTYNFDLAYLRFEN